MIPLDLSIPLCKFQSAVEYLIEDFCTRSSVHWSEEASLQNAQVKLTDWTIDSWRPSLSKTEISRLQRAFYRYNTCRSLMRAMAPFQGDGENFYGQLARFLSRFSPWEAEEIGCVHDYMSRRLDQVTEHLEEEFIQSVLDADRKIRQNEDIAGQASQSAEARLKCMSRNLHPEIPEERHCLGLS